MKKPIAVPVRIRASRIGENFKCYHKAWNLQVDGVHPKIDSTMLRLLYCDRLKA